jgi:hypothetical protein
LLFSCLSVRASKALWILFEMNEMQLCEYYLLHILSHRDHPACISDSNRVLHLYISSLQKYISSYFILQEMMFSMKKLMLPAVTMIQLTTGFQHSMMRFQSARIMSNMMMSSVPISYKVGFMFPGQGAQAVGMAGALCVENPAAKDLFDKASSILGYDLLDKCVNGPKEELDSTVVAQTAIFVSSMAALEKLKIDNPAAIESCTVAMGLSLGTFPIRNIIYFDLLYSMVSDEKYPYCLIMIYLPLPLG